VSSNNNNIRKLYGIIALINKIINHNSKEILILDACCFLTLKDFSNRKYGIISIYRSPAGDKIRFLDSLINILNNVINQYKYTTFILIGDINTDLLDTTNTTSKYIEILNSYNFTPYINAAIRSSSNTCLDHIFIYDCHNHFRITPTIIDSLIMNHYPIFLQLTQQNQNYRNKTENQNIKNQNIINYDCVISHLKKQIGIASKI